MLPAPDDGDMTDAFASPCRLPLQWRHEPGDSLFRAWLAMVAWQCRPVRFHAFLEGRFP
jgi:hypothetical protein